MAASDYVTLRGGLVLPVAALQLAWRLEAAGHDLRVDGDDLLISEPDRLTAEDVTAIRRWRRHLIAAVDYCQQPNLGAHLVV
jgi:hypothetical protein